MRQKEIVGSHFSNAFQADRANKLIIDGRIQPVLDECFDFEETATAHQRMADNQHKGKMAIRVQVARAA
jgi:NADPH:quinone reductase-like Zn-dependent oxidoreductase